MHQLFRLESQEGSSGGFSLVPDETLDAEIQGWPLATLIRDKTEGTDWVVTAREDWPILNRELCSQQLLYFVDGTGRPQLAVCARPGRSISY